MSEEKVPSYGDRLIRVGTLMNDKNSTLEDLVTACLDAGLILQFRVTPDPSTAIDFCIEDDKDA
jgi:hypothetical protein